MFYLQKNSEIELNKILKKTQFGITKQWEKPVFVVCCSLSPPIGLIPAEGWNILNCDNGTQDICFAKENEYWERPTHTQQARPFLQLEQHTSNAHTIGSSLVTPLPSCIVPYSLDSTLA